MKFECTFWNPESQLDIGETEFIEADNKTDAIKKMVKDKGDVSGFIKIWSTETGGFFYKVQSRGDFFFDLLSVKKNGELIKDDHSSTNQQTNTYSEEKPDGITLNEEPSSKKKNLTPDVSAWAMLHYVVGGICLFVFLISLSEGSGIAAQLMIALAIGCFIFGAILQSLKTICFYLREIYKRMD